MTITGNYQQLDMLQRDLMDIQQSSPALSFLLADKIKRFQMLNGMRLKVLNSKRNDLLLKHCLLDADGKPLLKDVDGAKQYSWISDLDKAAFEKEMMDLYQINFDIYA